MEIELTKLLNTLTLSLDYVENEIIKVARNHGNASLCFPIEWRLIWAGHRTSFTL